MDLKKWKVLNQKELISSHFFKMRVDECLLPNKKIMPHYYVFEFSDWVNVVALTKDRKLIMVDQYRHAAEDNFLEIPGGTTHPGKNEDPQLAAMRELREETGYTSQSWMYLGAHYPNPALQNNLTHTYLALECEKTCELELDEFEQLEVKEVSIDEVKSYLRSGVIKHSIIMASLFKALSHLNEI